MHPSVDTQLEYWHVLVKEADWSSIAALRLSFPTADFIGNDHYVFNIGYGKNAFRLVAMIHFSVRTVYLRWFGSHADYDRMNKSGLLSTI